MKKPMLITLGITILFLIIGVSTNILLPSFLKKTLPVLPKIREQTQLLLEKPIHIHTLTLTPQATTLNPGQTTIVAVILDSQAKSNQQFKLIQLEISFDPQALTAVNIQPGTLFNTENVVLNVINQHSGRISYALENKTTTKHEPTGTIAFITFTPVATFLGNETEISFLPKTMIKTKDETDILTATYGTRLIIEASEQK